MFVGALITQARTIAVLGITLVVFGAVIQDAGADKPVLHSSFAPVLQLNASMSKADKDRQLIKAISAIDDEYEALTRHLHGEGVPDDMTPKDLAARCISMGMQEGWKKLWALRYYLENRLPNPDEVEADYAKHISLQRETRSDWPHDTQETCASLAPLAANLARFAEDKLK